MAVRYYKTPPPRALPRAFRTLLAFFTLEFFVIFFYILGNSPYHFRSSHIPPTKISFLCKSYFLKKKKSIFSYRTGFPFARVYYFLNNLWKMLCWMVGITWLVFYYYYIIFVCSTRLIMEFFFFTIIIFFFTKFPRKFWST